MNIPVLTDDDRKAHPYNSEEGVQAIVILNQLDDKDILALLNDWDLSDIYLEFKRLFSFNAWVYSPFFLWNTARDIGVNRKNLKKDIEIITPPYRRAK